MTHRKISMSPEISFLRLQLTTYEEGAMQQKFSANQTHAHKGQSDQSKCFVHYKSAQV